MQNNNVALPVAVDAQDDESEGSSGLKVRTNLKAGVGEEAAGLIVPRRGPGGYESLVSTSYSSLSSNLLAVRSTMNY